MKTHAPWHNATPTSAVALLIGLADAAAAPEAATSGSCGRPCTSSSRCSRCSVTATRRQSSTVRADRHRDRASTHCARAVIPPDPHRSGHRRDAALRPQGTPYPCRPGGMAPGPRRALPVSRVREACRRVRYRPHATVGAPRMQRPRQYAPTSVASTIRVKHRTSWQMRQGHDGVIRWLSPAGRWHDSHPEHPARAG